MANEINAVAGQLFGVPVGQVYTAGPGVVIDNVHKTVSVGTLDWEDVSSSVTSAKTGTKLLYCAPLNLCMLSIIFTGNISTNNALGNVGSDYRPATSIITASAMLNNNAYCRAYVESNGNITMSANASASNVGVRITAMWVAGK